MTLKELPTAAWERILRDGRVSSHISIAIAGALLLPVAFFYFRGLYRLYLHPLSSFPGPREAAKSDSWLYSQIRTAFPEATFQELHQRHQAKAIRIAPNELHIADTTLYKVIYKQADPFPKHEAFYLGFCALSPTVFTVVDQSAHRERRRMLSSMFSRAGVLKVEGVILEQLNMLEKKIDRLCDKQNIDLYDACRLWTTAIILEFCFAESGGMMEEQSYGFKSKFLKAFSVVQKLTIGIVGTNQFARTCVEQWRQAREKGTNVKHPIVLDNLESLDDDALVAESLDLLVAGSDTSATSLTVAVMEILSHPSIEKRLVEELDAAIPDKDNLPSVISLEKIAYLNACVKEGVRFATAVPGRLPRVVPDNGSTPFVVDNKLVPPGTIVSISAHTMHSSTDLWGADARSFNPDRWLQPGAKHLEEYQVAFSKGSRMCLGMNLVPVELTIALASFFRKYKLSFPPGFIPPRKVDNFTVELYGGLPLKVSRRA
ncbi:hypothetical protein FOXYS1_908 [Fusarium oxysporum]|uniref:Cytochrome P450 n=1 Tax=Fusarium oxysporum TaxID=5507 RepID=A0A8H5AQT2_FUSOX|nr:hypothetical protein FOXYS1_908 [Fusarium oxysporum]